MSSARLIIPLVAFLYLTQAPLVSALYPTELIYQFPNGTWVENLAVRPDGSILTTIVTSPELYLIQPSSANPNPKLVHHFDGSTSLLGITETAPNAYQVVVANRTTDPIQVTPGSSSLWRVSFSAAYGHKATVSLTARLPTAGFPNGLVTLNETRVLLADSTRGVIWAIDTDTGASEVAITDPLLAPTKELSTGVNGIKIHGGTLYFTNSAQNLLGQIQIDPETGVPQGPGSIIAHVLPPSKGYDDFALNSGGDVAFLSNSASESIEYVNLKTRRQAFIAGSINSTDIAQPTAAAFGRGRASGRLFVTTSGGLYFPVKGDEIVGGQLVAVYTGKSHRFGWL